MMSPVLEVALHHGVLVQLEKRAGDFLEVGQLQQFLDVDRLAAAARSCTTLLLVSAPVGHETMHSPQETHDELPIGRL